MGGAGIMKYFYVLHSESFVAFEQVELYKNFSANVYTSPNSGDACFFRARLYGPPPRAR